MTIEKKVVEASFHQDFAEKLIAAGAEGWRADPKHTVLDGWILSIGLIRGEEEVNVSTEQEAEALDASNEAVVKPEVSQPVRPGRPPKK